jgi:hypothetical protein
VPTHRAADRRSIRQRSQEPAGAAEDELRKESPTMAMVPLTKRLHTNDDGSYWQELHPRPDYRVEHFYAYAHNSKYIFATTGELWSGKKLGILLSDLGLFNPKGERVTSRGGEFGEISRRVSLKPLVFLARYRMVHQIVSRPGEPRIIRDRLWLADGAMVEHAGALVFNRAGKD